MQTNNLTAISAIEFANRFTRSILEQGQRFTWFIGAGCSISSGIPATTGLVQRWLDELYDMQERPGPDLNTWAGQMFPNFDPQNPGALYADVFARRHPAPMERQREIEVICAKGYPAYGYATFAQLLSDDTIGHLCNTILTTNFDDLVADAIYLYGDTRRRPQVITHEALARYARISSPRPTIVKLHGDAHLDPKNLRPETKEINEDVARQIYPFLQDSALIFIGYGGNDESILNFLRASPTPALAPQIYWVGKHDPSEKFREWLIDRAALRVEHTNFDRLMHLLRGPLKLSHPDEQRWNKAKDMYFNQHREFERMVEKQPAGVDKAALQQASSEVRGSLPDEWLRVERAIALEQSDPNAAEDAFRNALEAHPTSAILAGEFARFLHEAGRDADTADIYYRRAIEADPTHANALGNYALFLEDVRKDMDAADTYYKRAIEADLTDANALGNYATFLNAVRKDMDAAETYYKRAIEADPTHANNLGNYATFLKNVRNNMDAAETYYKRAIEADPAHAGTLGNYASFLKIVRKDMDAAESYYKRAIEADPTHANTLGNYANFLNTVRKDMDAAESYYKRAIEADLTDASSLGNYANFLNTVRKELDAAETYYKSAIEADPAHASTLGNYANFLNTVRKDMNAAETYYKRAIEVDPTHANNLGNYANFLNTVRKDMDAAETYYKRAIEADPAHASTLGNYANFLNTVRKDMDAAETYYKRAIVADPTHANNLGNYALYLQDVRKDMAAAEAYFKRANEADPTDANILGNYARFLLCAGKRVEGLRWAERALSVSSKYPSVTLEVLVYLYALKDRDRKQHLSHLKNELMKGARSPQWDFSGIMAQAQECGHPHMDMLKNVAAVVSDRAPITVLEPYAEWRSA